MAIITMQQMYDAWKKVADWVGGSADKANVRNVNGSGAEIFTDANPGSMKLTGRNVEEVVVQNALAITNTSFIQSATIDVSKYRSISFAVLNTHDQAVTFYVQQGGTVLTPATTKTWDGTAFTELSLSIPSGASIRNVFDASAFKAGGVMPKTIRVLLRCTVAPTSGQITVLLWGVPN